MSSHVTSKAGSGARAPEGDGIASLATGQLLFDWDTRTDVVSYGGAYEHVLGYSLAELTGDLAWWIGLVHPEDRSAFNDVIRHVLATKTPSRQRYRLRRKDDSFIVVESSGYPVLARDGSIIRFVCLVADVSERKNAEAVCAEDAETSAALARVGRELMSSLETPVLLERLCRLTTQVLDGDFSTTWIWQAAEEVYAPISSHGLSHEEWEALRVLRIPRGPSSPLGGLEVDDLVYVTGDSTDAPVTAAVLAHYGFSAALCMPLRRGGDMIGVQAAGYRTRRAPLTPAQERIARGIAQLASMALTNAQLFEELESASRLKSEFVSTMSHELRTPLNVTLGYLDMLTDEPMPGAQKLLLARVRRSTLALLEMIEATLDLNRIAAGKDPPSFETVSLARLWDELGTELAAVTSIGDVALRWEPAADAELRTDRRKLKTILKNLVGNALKFTPAGEVVVRGQRDDAGWIFTVRDTGIGIPPEHLPHVFEMFRQVDSSDARSYGGTGLGLYIVHQLTAQLGGAVEVESEPGRGSIFRVTLPAVPLVEGPQLAA